MTDLLVTGLQVTLLFSTLQLSLPSITGKANGVHTPNRLFARLTVSAVKAPKVTHVGKYAANAIFLAALTKTPIKVSQLD